MAQINGETSTPLTYISIEFGAPGITVAPNGTPCASLNGTSHYFTVLDSKDLSINETL